MSSFEFVAAPSAACTAAADADAAYCSNSQLSILAECPDQASADGAHSRQAPPAPSAPKAPPPARTVTFAESPAGKRHREGQQSEEPKPKGKKERSLGPLPAKDKAHVPAAAAAPAVPAVSARSRRQLDEALRIAGEGAKSSPAAGLK